MAIKIAGKPAPQTTQAAPPSTTVELSTLGSPDATAGEGPNLNPSPATHQAPPPGGVVDFGPQTQASFLMSGQAQQTAISQIKATQDLRAKLRSGAREFWIDPGQFANLYFLDGQLIGPKQFDTPMAVVHMMQIAGDWVKFVCNKNIEGKCLACDSNAESSQPMTLQLFTVINTMPYTIQNGPRKGVTVPARIQLFGANYKAREILCDRAETHGGYLAGNLFRFTRHTKQDPRTGNDVAWQSAIPMVGVLNKYPALHVAEDGKTPAPTRPYDYVKAFPVLANAELAALRPELINMAGWAGMGNPMVQAYQPATMGAMSTGDDEIPFDLAPAA